MNEQKETNEKILEALTDMSASLKIIVEKLTQDDDPQSQEELSQDEYLKLKEKYWNLYYTDIMDYEFMYRDLTRNEFRTISKFDNNAAAEEYICSTCIIFPQKLDFDEMPAGIPSILAGQIISESGFDVINEKTSNLLKKYREEMTLLENQISCVIHEAFPYMPIEDIDNLSLEKTIFFYSRAEYILNELQNRDISIIGATEEESAAEPVKRDFVSPDSISGDLSDPAARRLKAFLEGKEI